MDSMAVGVFFNVGFRTPERAACSSFDLMLLFHSCLGMGSYVDSFAVIDSDLRGPRAPGSS